MLRKWQLLPLDSKSSEATTSTLLLKLRVSSPARSLRSPTTPMSPVQAEHPKPPIRDVVQPRVSPSKKLSQAAAEKRSTIDKNIKQLFGARMTSKGIIHFIFLQFASPKCSGLKFTLFVLPSWDTCCHMFCSTFHTCFWRLNKLEIVQCFGNKAFFCYSKQQQHKKWELLTPPVTVLLKCTMCSRYSKIFYDILRQG